MKIYLKNNWADQFRYDSSNIDNNNCVFIGREHQINDLKQFIFNTESGSILVSGVRGSGKTSFVHKVLHELCGGISKKCKCKYVPVFINLGHVLSYVESKGSEHSKAAKHYQINKREFIKALIRTLHLNECFFKKDKELEELYHASIAGKYELIDSQKFVNNAFLGASGSAGAKASFFGFVKFSGDFSSYLKYLQNKLTGKNKVIDNSTEYLEIELEKWLKKKSSKYKIIFVIDELDKIKEDTIFDFIKEFKNLFTRSLSHFIFITSQQAYDYVIFNDRYNSVDEGGHIPTMFSHIIYLPLPSEEELREYLYCIFGIKNKSKEIENLISYLLFKSKNDFFELKRVVSNFVFFEKKGNELVPYLDINEIKSNDVHFDKKVELYDYVMKWYINFFSSKLKENWQSNSDMQYKILSFLNKHYPYSFNKQDLNEDTVVSRFSEWLVGIGQYKYDENNERYLFVGKYNKDINARLNREEREFIKLYQYVDQVLNIETFFDLVSCKHLSSIDRLMEASSKYEQIYEKLKNQRDRLVVSIDEVKDAIRVIKDGLELFHHSFWNIILCLVEKELPTGFIKSNIHTVSSYMNNYPVHQLFNGVLHSVYVSQSNNRASVLLNNFDLNRLNNTFLKDLKNRENVVIVNLIANEDVGYTIEHGLKINDFTSDKVKEISQDDDDNMITNFVNIYYTKNDLDKLDKIVKNIRDLLFKE